VDVEFIFSVIIYLLGTIFCGWDLGLNSVELGTCLKGILDGLIDTLP